MVYAYKFVQEEIDYLAGRMEVKEIFDDHIDFLKGQEIVKVLYMNTDYDYLKKSEDDLKDITGDLDVSYSSNRYIEFNHQGVNKGQGLKKLADILGVDIKETIAIGDNFNDLDMIENVGLGVAMGNAPDEIKQAANRVTASHNDDGIALILNEIFPE